ncbi:unnamed protein product [Pleuronectes platessa]|uniref:RRM domain-containing protein n=1 Tax=Pleuronectes platessa TaxID=8262 RepID=A0A9N7YVL1_PLEPL|nr:unnamed protein product [Pleuronectes platessa]
MSEFNTGRLGLCPYRRQSYAPPPPPMAPPSPGITGGGGGGGHGGGHGGGLMEQLSKTNLYIRGLPPATTDQDLIKLCQPYGKIVSTKAILDKNTNQCKESYKEKINLQRSNRRPHGYLWRVAEIATLSVGVICRTRTAISRATPQYLAYGEWQEDKPSVE